MTLQLLRGHDTAEAGNDDDADVDYDVDDVSTSEGDDVTMNDAMQ